MSTKRALDPRISNMLDHWMRKFDFSDYLWVLQPLDKKACKTTYARCTWNHPEREVLFEFGPTVGYSEKSLEAIIVHEVGHGLTRTLMGSEPGSVADEQACNLLGRLLVPDAERPMPRLWGTWAVAICMAKVFDDSDREALEDAMPHLIVRMSQAHRDVLIAIFYDGKNLSDIGRELGVNRSTVMRRRDAALEALREMFLAGGR